MQRLVASGVSEVVLAQQAERMGAGEVILAALVADVAVNNRYRLSPFCPRFKRNEALTKRQISSNHSPSIPPRPATAGRRFAWETLGAVTVNLQRSLCTSAFDFFGCY
jgi:hypothetical protein